MELGDSATMTVPPGALRHCRTSNYTGGTAEPAIDLGFRVATRRRPGGDFKHVRRRTIGYKDMCADDMFCVVLRLFRVDGLLSPARTGSSLRRLRTGVTYPAETVALGDLALAERQESCHHEQQGQGARRRPAAAPSNPPACARTCAAEAIVFGDLHDPNSRVSQLAHDARAFHVLEELNTHPAITYLRRSNAGTRDES